MKSGFWNSLSRWLKRTLSKYIRLLMITLVVRAVNKSCKEKKCCKKRKKTLSSAKNAPNPSGINKYVKKKPKRKNKKF